MATTHFERTLLRLLTVAFLCPTCFAQDDQSRATQSTQVLPQSKKTALSLFEVTQPQMGTRCRVLVYARDKATANNGCRRAFTEMKRLTAILSDYEKDSEIRTLCRAEPGRAVSVSDELFQVLLQSQSLARKSNGAFDVTVGPFVQLWRASRRSRSLPQKSELTAARNRTGFQRVLLDAHGKTVTLQAESMQLDVGGIAKGYIADAALQALRTAGMPRALVDAGGDIVVGDPPPGRAAWRIAVRDLQQRRDRAGATTEQESAKQGPKKSPNASPDPQILNLVNQAAATSGDVFQFVEIAGTRYSHIIDPRTGLGLTRRSSVTVVAKNGMLADGLASAVSVLGAERGVALIEATPETEAFVVEIRGATAEPTRKSSSGFHALTLPRGEQK